MKSVKFRNPVEHENDFQSERGSFRDDDSGDEHQQQKEQEEEKKLAQKETKLVRNFKVMVFAALGLSAVAVALAVYFYLSNAEEAEFKKQFDDDSIKVFSSLGSNLDLSLGAADAFATSVMSVAQATNQTWPFVTIPNFGVQAGKVLSLSSAYIINLYTLVEDHQRAEWEAYMSENNAWVDETILLHDKDSSFSPPKDPDYVNFNVIHGYDEFEKENPGVNGTDKSGPYLVWWQCYPVVPIDPVYAWDLLTDYDMEANLKSHLAEITAPYLIAFENDTERQIANDAEAEWVKNYIDPDENPREPVSDVLYPLLDNSLEVLDVFKDGNYTAPNNQTFHGYLSMSIYWRDMLRNILPPGSEGMVIVVDNACSPSFTYQIDGPAVVYLGDNDKHDGQFDDMVHESDLVDLRKYSVKASTYSGAPLLDRCPFHVRIYPSEAKRDAHTSSDPILFAGVAALIFLFTSAAFVLYDFWVERRQRLVLKTAERSTAIVSSLFPATVRDRMYTEKEQAKEAQRRRNMFLDQEDGSGTCGDLPIADHFEETTVLFADLVGFTSWCDSKTPSEVFLLLETLYGEFDKVAEARAVFKVETIGDCYVAVTGLPTPQAKHACIMVRFAAECREKMKVVVSDLDGELNTGNLQIRIGIHSGPCTAGVLRGQKARFQIFGDTVNTAARMESNGFANLIHVSDATAQCLKECNKGNWLTPRKDKIFAKGKGELQTFWAEPRSSVTTNSVGSSPTKSREANRHNQDQSEWEETRQRLAERYALDWTSEE